MRLQDEGTVKSKGKNEGYVLVTVALSLVALLGFGGFAVDLGMLYSARGAAQRAAAAALAGALSFVVTPLEPQPQTAIDRAVQVATSNTIYDNAIQVADLTVPVDVPNRLDIPAKFHRAPGVRRATIPMKFQLRTKARARGRPKARN